MSQIDNVVLTDGSEFCFYTTQTFAATLANRSAEQAFTLTAAAPVLKPTDAVAVYDPTGPGNALTLASARVSSNGQLVINVCNATAGSLTYPANKLLVQVVRAPLGTPSA